MKPTDPISVMTDVELEAYARSLRRVVQAVESRAVDAIKAVPHRSGTPEWSKGAAVAQAAGFDMGLAYAADAVRAALAEGSSGGAA